MAAPTPTKTLSLSDFREGELVLYVPIHAAGNIRHKDVEQGRVSSIGRVAVFVRFGDQPNAKACDPESLVKAGQR